MKTKTKAILTMATMSVLAATSAMAAPGGTDILHYSVRATMTNEGVEPSAAGTVQASQKTQGKASKQDFRVTLSGLSGSTDYTLAALIADDTNLTDIATFTTDGEGHAKVFYKTQGKGKGKGHGGLPAELNPVSNVAAVSIVDSNALAVLTADLTAPDKFEYLIKRNVSSNSVTGTLRINANAQQAQVRLNASGLAPTTDYWLVLNDVISSTNTTDAAGNLAATAQITPPIDALNLQSVALWDTSSNVVLSTQLP